VPIFSDFDRALMAIAIDEANAALTHDDVPIGAVIAIGDHVVARRHNERELTNDPTAHAEVLALRDAAQVLGGWRFDGATMVVTIEPCVMCAGAAQQSRLSRVVFGAFDLKAGALGSLYNVGVDARLNHEFAVDGGLMADECAALVSQFFAGLRRDPSQKG
jgi:tRNA(adenine34) deaminase